MAKLQSTTKKIISAIATIGAAGTVTFTTLLSNSNMNLLQRSSRNIIQEEDIDVTLKWDTDSENFRDDTISSDKKKNKTSYSNAVVIPDMFKDYVKAGSIGKTRAKILINAASQVGHCGWRLGTNQPWTETMSSYGWFDCSHFQYWCYSNNFSIELQHGYKNCSSLLASDEYEQIGLGDAKPGDLLVCNSHVMMFIGYSINTPLKLVAVDCGGDEGEPILSGKSFDNVSNYYKNGTRFKPVSLNLEITPGVTKWFGDNLNIDARNYKILRNKRLSMLDEIEKLANDISDDNAMSGVNNKDASEVSMLNGYVKLYDNPTKKGKYDRVEVPMTQSYIQRYGGASSYVSDRGLGLTAGGAQASTWTMGEGRSAGFNSSLMSLYRSREDAGFMRNACIESVPGIGFYTYNGRYLVAAGIGLFITREETANFFTEHNAQQSAFLASEYYDRQHWNGYIRSLCFDVVLRDPDGNKVYLPCILADSKAHNYDTGIVQTGIHCTQTDYTGKYSSYARYADGSLIEFVGTNAVQGSSVGNFGNGYVVDSVLVYWKQ